jgi:hypothetical protein
MSRKLVQIKSKNFQVFGCFECIWVFDSAGPFVGNTHGEMMRKCKPQRDKEFAAHACSEKPKRHEADRAIRPTADR